MRCPRCGLDTREFISAYRDGGDCPGCGWEYERMGLLFSDSSDSSEFKEQEVEPWATLNSAPDPEAARAEWQRDQEGKS